MRPRARHRVAEYEAQQEVHSPDIPTLDELEGGSSGGDGVGGSSGGREVVATFGSNSITGARPATSSGADNSGSMSVHGGGTSATEGGGGGGAGSGGAGAVADMSSAFQQPYDLAGLSLSAFACKEQRCGGRLAVDPAVLSCGHLVGVRCMAAAALRWQRVSSSGAGGGGLDRQPCSFVHAPGGRARGVFAALKEVLRRIWSANTPPPPFTAVPNTLTAIANALTAHRHLHLHCHHHCLHHHCPHSTATPATPPHTFGTLQVCSSCLPVPQPSRDGSGQLGPTCCPHCRLPVLPDAGKCGKVGMKKRGPDIKKTRPSGGAERGQRGELGLVVWGCEEEAAAGCVCLKGARKGLQGVGSSGVDEEAERGKKGAERGGTQRFKLLGRCWKRLELSDTTMSSLSDILSLCHHTLPDTCSCRRPSSCSSRTNWRACVRRALMRRTHAKAGTAAAAVAVPHAAEAKLRRMAKAQRRPPLRSRRALNPRYRGCRRLCRRQAPGRCAQGHPPTRSIGMPCHGSTCLPLAPRSTSRMYGQHSPEAHLHACMHA
eukprot:352103-Chlamydomonas_euryale.AAC.6